MKSSGDDLPQNPVLSRQSPAQLASSGLVRAKALSKTAGNAMIIAFKAKRFCARSPPLAYFFIADDRWLVVAVHRWVIIYRSARDQNCIPITGFLGSGKTTSIRHLLHKDPGKSGPLPPTNLAKYGDRRRVARQHKGAMGERDPGGVCVLREWSADGGQLEYAAMPGRTVC